MQKTRFPTSTAKSEGMSDEEVVVQVLTGETALFEIIMRRYNRRLYRRRAPFCVMKPRPKRLSNTLTFWLISIWRSLQGEPGLELGFYTLRLVKD